MHFLFIRSNEETHREINNFRVRKTTVSSIFLSDQGFNGTVVNRALPSFHGGSLEITLTVPLVPEKNLCTVQLFLESHSLWVNLYK